MTVNLKESTYFIDNIISEKNKYIDLISKQVFGQLKEKPSIRMISHKFIRNTNEKMQNTTKFLNQNSTPDTYDQLYLFLFGFMGLDLLRDKAKINNQLKTKNKHLAAYRQPDKEKVLRKMIAPLEVEKSELKNKIATFDFSESQETDVKELVNIQKRISEINISYSKVKLRIGFLNRSIEKLKENATSIDGKELYNIYKEAGVSISGNLKKSYENLVVFHNKIIFNKINILNKSIGDYRLEEKIIGEEIELLHKEESNIFKGIKEPNALKSIGKMYSELSKIEGGISSFYTLLGKIEDTKDAIDLLEGSKEKIIGIIVNSIKSLDQNIEEFNNFFGELSKIFYDEQYVFDFKFDPEKEKCSFDITSISPNSTGGKKKGELSVFDLAYIKFVKSVHLKRPTFVIHDSIEDVDVNQVFDIFNIADNLDGQYIVALLGDKISGKEFLKFKKNSVILELSENNKFFKL